MKKIGKYLLIDVGAPTMLLLQTKVFREACDRVLHSSTALDLIKFPTLNLPHI